MSSRVRFVNNSELHLEITQEVLEGLLKCRQFDGNEKAGILLGSEVGDNAFRINKVSHPCVVSTASSVFDCVRDAKKANDFIKLEFEKSNKTRFYIGEWHTHPEDFPIPSLVDVSSIKEISRGCPLPADIVVLIIVGRKKLYCGYCRNGDFVGTEPKIV